MKVGDVLIYDSDLLGSWWTYSKEYPIIKIKNNNIIVLDDDGDEYILEGSVLDQFKLK